MVDKNKRKKFIIVLIFLVMLFTEGMARLLYAFREEIVVYVLGRRSGLDPYEMVDPNNRLLWRLRPGFSYTMEQTIAAKKKSGRILKVDLLQKKKDKVKKEEVIFQINKDGFKGPEIDKKHSQTRIVTLGDSCTFGTEIDRFCYPRSLEKALKKKKFACEVINAGVEGYGPKQVLLRIEEYKTLKPEVVTLYIGWNALYGEEQFPSKDILHFVSRNIYTLILLQKAYNRLIKKQSALDAYKKSKKPDIKDPWLKKLEGYTPPVVYQVEQIITQLHPKSKVVLVTLPGLYTLEPPTATAQKMGHLPVFTNNPYLWAKMVIAYNKSLRQLAKKYNLFLIDLEKWSLKTLKPRDAYFTDSVHLTDQGQKMLGEYMAEKLAPILSKK